MTDKIFQIGVFHDEVRTEDTEVIIKKAKDKMSLKYGFDFSVVGSEFFEIKPLAEKSVHLVTLKLEPSESCSKVGIINDLCKIYMNHKSKQKD